MTTFYIRKELTVDFEIPTDIKEEIEKEISLFGYITIGDFFDKFPNYKGYFNRLYALDLSDEITTIEDENGRCLFER